MSSNSKNFIGIYNIAHITQQKQCIGYHYEDPKSKFKLLKRKILSNLSAMYFDKTKMILYSSSYKT